MDTRKGFFFLIAFGLGLSTIWAGAIIKEFRGEPGYNKVTLKWITSTETNLKGFEIERGLNETSLKKIDFVKAEGAQEYTYVDKSVFRTYDRTFYYRLKLVDNDGRFSYSGVISVTPSISGVQQTWGSIKAMFR